jgi:hypothetical protein
LFIPFILFLAGGYLLYRGIKRLVSVTKVFSGSVSVASPVKSHITKQNCAYSKLLVEYYHGGHIPWQPIYTTEKKAQFSINGKTFDPKYADIRISNTKTSAGYIKHEAGFLARLGLVLKLPISTLRPLAKSIHDTVYLAHDACDLTNEVRQNEFIDDSILLTVLEDKIIAAKIKPHLKKPLRISEYTIPEGKLIWVAIDSSLSEGDKALAGTFEFPLIISDIDEQIVLSTIKEKMYLSLLLGSFLIIFAVVFAFSFLSQST